jgi:carbon-monoxide dehydrogenase medium subunit
VAVGCVSPFPCRHEDSEGLLRGARSEVEQRLPETAEALADAAELVDDHEGSADFKRHLIAVFLKRAFLTAVRGEDAA